MRLHMFTLLMLVAATDVSDRSERIAAVPRCGGPIIQAILQAIDRSRIVVVGEPTHGDGAAFEFRNELVRCLHQGPGFDVLALESGFAQMEAVDAAVAAGKPAAEAAALGVLSLWRTSAEMMDLLEYVASSRNGAQPIQLVGFDMQNTAVNRDAWREQILVPLKAAVGASKLIDEVADDHAAFFRGKADAVTHRRLLDNLSALDSLILRLLKGGAGPREQVLGIQRRALRDLAVQVSLFLDFRFENPRAFTVADNNPRDARMAENILWLFRDRFPGRKGVVLMASLHAIHHPDRVRDMDGKPTYGDFRSTGSILKEQLGSDLYTIAFSAMGGRWGIGDGEDGTGGAISPPPGDAVESLAAEPDRQTVFVNFRNLPQSHPLRQTRPGLFLGYKPLTAPWAEQMDGTVIFREMSVSRAP